MPMIETPYRRYFIRVNVRGEFVGPLYRLTTGGGVIKEEVLGDEGWKPTETIVRSLVKGEPLFEEYPAPVVRGEAERRGLGDVFD